MRSILLGLTLALPAWAAQSASVTLTGWDHGRGHVVSGNLYSGKAGGFEGRLEGAGAFDTERFVTYCVELGEGFSFSSTAMTGYRVVDGVAYFGAERADALGRLVGYSLSNPGLVDSAEESTSFQLAVWNLVYDTDWNVTEASSFEDHSVYAAHADLLLKGAAGLAHGLVTVSVLERRGTQDFLLARTTPRVPEALAEPGTPALALLSALVAAAAWRRRRAAAVASPC